MAESIVLYTDGGNRNTGNQAGGSVRPTDKSAWAALLIYGDHEKCYLTATMAERIIIWKLWPLFKA